MRCVALSHFTVPPPPISRNTAGYEPDKQHVPALFEKVLTAIAHPDGLSPEGPCNAGAFRLSMCVCVGLSLPLPLPLPPSLPPSLPPPFPHTHTHTLPHCLSGGCSCVRLHALQRKRGCLHVCVWKRAGQAVSLFVTTHMHTKRGALFASSPHSPPLVLPSFSPHIPFPSFILSWVALLVAQRGGGERDRGFRTGPGMCASSAISS